MKHYRFTEMMIFLIDDEKKTIEIKGPYGYEDLQHAEATVLAYYLNNGFTLCKPKES